jgi:8-oxo-dGTP diphosphatase
LPVTEQGITTDRYMLIPRTAIFVRQGDRYLLLLGAPTKRLWAGKYNGVGGHVEQGEDILTAARRELLEETGLEIDLWLCGTVIVDTGRNPGVCLFVFSGDGAGPHPAGCVEGETRWVSLENLAELPVVEDVPVILDRLHRMRPGDVPFAARSYYDKEGRLAINFL